MNKKEYATYEMQQIAQKYYEFICAIEPSWHKCNAHVYANFMNTRMYDEGVNIELWRTQLESVVSIRKTKLYLLVNFYCNKR